MPREADASWQDGMRSVHRHEFESLDALTSAVFRPGLVAQYPHLFNSENAGNLRVVVKDGEVVSHIGTIRRHASIVGCTVRVACVGGVGTREDHRGKGYATALLADTIRACREDGVDFMVVSGYRKMYHRHGCRYVGRDWEFTVTRDAAGDFDDAGIEVLPVVSDDLPALAALYRREPVRWLRPLSDYAHAQVGYVMNRPAHVLGVRENGALRGYVILQQARESDGGKVQVLESAGDRKSLVGIWGRLMTQYDLQSLRVHVMGCDRLMQDLMEERGLKGSPAHVSGTVMLIHFTQFMERMRPYFAEILGETAARGLVFEEQSDEVVFYYGGDRIVAEDRGAAAQLIFGTPERAEEALLKAGGRAGEVLREIFPIPGLWYGVNYV